MAAKPTWKVKVRHWKVKVGRLESESEVMANKSEGETVDGGETNLSLTSLGDQYHLKSIKVFINSNQPEILLLCVMMEN